MPAAVFNNLSRKGGAVGKEALFSHVGATCALLRVKTPESSGDCRSINAVKLL
jgi:hypothetical protein